MEWCCAKCGLSATADDWTLLLSMGWRETADGDRRCSICAKRESARLRAEPRRAVQLVTAGDRGRALR